MLHSSAEGGASCIYCYFQKILYSFFFLTLILCVENNIVQMRVCACLHANYLANCIFYVFPPHNKTTNQHNSRRHPRRVKAKKSLVGHRSVGEKVWPSTPSRHLRISVQFLILIFFAARLYRYLWQSSRKGSDGSASKYFLLHGWENSDWLNREFVYAQLKCLLIQIVGCAIC